MQRQPTTSAPAQAEQFTASPSDLLACPPQLDHADKHSLAERFNADERCSEIMQHVTPNGMASEAAR